MEPPPSSSIAEHSPSSYTGELTPQPGSARPPMFRSLSNIFENVVPHGYVGAAFIELRTLLELGDAGVEVGKALRAVLSVLKYLQENSPATLVPATKFLADGSRYGKLVMAASEVTQRSRRDPD